MRIPCTCGCGLQVTHATKINHLNGRGKTSLRARVLEENESLKPSTSQQPVLLRDHQKKKRSHPSSDQVGNRKRFKVAQHEVDQIPEISLREDADPMGSLLVRNEESEILPAQAYTESMESPPTPVPNQVPEFPDYLPSSQADAGPEELLPTLEPNSGRIGDGSADALSSARRSNRIAERTREVTERRWGNSHLRDEIPRSDCGGGGYRSEDEEDIDVTMTGDEDKEDEDKEDEDREDEDREDEDDNNPFAESDVAGISTWDLLGEGFEREVSSIGMFFSQ